LFYGTLPFTAHAVAAKVLALGLGFGDALPLTFEHDRPLELSNRAENV
jgi:hypothetical protein